MFNVETDLQIRSKLLMNFSGVTLNKKFYIIGDDNQNEAFDFTTNAW
jgi:hypothetical protein